ncbi:MAG: RluA family pseudouridine synthase [Patescibacteria group bacterium]
MFKIIYQSKDYLVINKPAGLQVHPDAKNKGHTLTDLLLKDFPSIKDVGESSERPGIVHRLDKDTSGVMLVVLNKAAFYHFKKQFQRRKIKKTYWALVHGLPKKSRDVISLPIGRSLKNTRLRTASPYSRDKKLAQTAYQVLKTYSFSLSPKKQIPYALLQVFPRTGRTHQIRVHLKSIGHPICGDPVYKFKRLVPPPGLNRLFLISKKIEFNDLQGKKQAKEIKLDKELKQVLEKLKND